MLRVWHRNRGLKWAHGTLSGAKNWGISVPTGGILFTNVAGISNRKSTSDLLAGVDISRSGSLVFARSTAYDVAGNIMTVRNESASTMYRRRIGYVLDALGQRTGADMDDGTRWAYGYNARSEVTVGVEAGWVRSRHPAN